MEPISGIEDKVVAITGASSGIGEQAALLLARRGAKLVLGARRDDLLDDLVRRIEATGGQACYANVDVTKRADLEALVNASLQKFGKLDVLVSNAGIGPISLLEDLRVDDWEDMIDVNLKGFLYGIAAALPVFRRQHRGHFVTIVSTAGLKIVPQQAVYAATKNGVRTISEGLRQEVGSEIRVTAISPGFVHTDFAKSMTDPDIRAKTLAARDAIAITPDAIACDRFCNRTARRRGHQRNRVTADGAGVASGDVCYEAN